MYLIYGPSLFGYWDHLVIGIIFGLAQSDPIKQRHCITIFLIPILFIILTGASLFQDAYAPWTSLAYYPKDYGSITSAFDTDCSLACSIREKNGNGQVNTKCYHLLSYGMIMKDYLSRGGGGGGVGV